VNVLPSAANVECRLNGFRKAWKKRCETNAKCRKGAPVYPDLVVAVDAIAFVELVDVQLALFDDIIVALNEKHKVSDGSRKSRELNIQTMVPAKGPIRQL